MKKLKTIVVEDERLPRLSLLQKLEDYRHMVDVVDACDSYDKARDSILRHQPDLLLLDIQLQGRDSIQLLEELKQTIRLPYVIFTTAYSDRKYLMSAIKLAAVDYLVKPIDKGQLALAIAKAAKRADDEKHSAVEPTRKMSFRSVNGRLFILPDDIAYIRAEGNYARVVTFHGDDLVLESLLSLQQRLPQQVFMRVDRSTIVNSQRVYRLNTQQSSCTLQDADGRQLVVKLSSKGIQQLLNAASL